MTTEVTFRIDGYTPKTLPMARLAEYLVQLAALYGERESVHFQKLRKGSAIVVSTVDSPAIPKVADRIVRAKRIDAPQELGATFDRLDAMLATDNSRGMLKLDAPGYDNVLVFPGRDRPKLIEFGAVRQDGFIDGELIRIGGKDSTVHLTLLDGDVQITGVVTDRETARQLAPLIFGPIVRLWGTGSWARGPDGVWAVSQFRVARFEQLADDEDLATVVERLRDVGGSEWSAETDPVATLLRMRHGEGEH